MTGSTGTVVGANTFDAYGNQTGHTGAATTPLGFDGQYTSSDTGLIYLRARVYDPGTVQFMSADPIAGLTLQPYNYVNDNPLNYNDPTGLIFGIPGTPSTSQIAGTVAEGTESAANAVNTAGKAVAGVAHYAAPVIDATAAGICILAPEGCAVAFVANLGVQQLLAADQAVYNPNYNIGLNEAVLFAGAGLGAVGISGVAGSELSYLGRLALGGAVGSPQFFLDAAELLSPNRQRPCSCVNEWMPLSHPRGSDAALSLLWRRVPDWFDSYFCAKWRVAATHMGRRVYGRNRVAPKAICASRNRHR